MTGDRLRVLHVNKLYHPWIGGVERVVQDLSEGLVDRFEVSVLACQPRGRGRTETMNGVRVVRSTSLGMFMGMPISPTLPFLLALMSRSRDVIHLHFPFPIGALAYLLLASRRPKLIVHYHSDLVRQKGFLTLYRWLARAVLKRADEIVVTSPVLLEKSPLLAPFRDRAKVVPLFVRPLPSPSDDFLQRLRSRHGLDGRDPIVLFVGRLAYYKGVHYLLEAMRSVEAKLLVVGTGPLENEVREIIVRNGLRDRVVLLGSVEDDELAACYALSDLLVLPSVEPTEAFGLVQIEAMAHGLPVVNTDLATGVPWVSQHGVTGLTVKPRDKKALADALTRLLQDPAMRAEYGDSARRRATEFSAEVVLQTFTDLYLGRVVAR